jgi:hypothetical protein
MDTTHSRTSVVICLFFSIALLVPADNATAAIRDGLIGYWPYNGDSLDYSGLANHGTRYVNPQFVTGKLGTNALYFKGDNYVTMDGVANDTSGNNISLNAWVKTTDPEADWYSCNTSTGGNVFMFSINLGQAAVYDSAYEGLSGITVNNNQWHMLTYVRSGSTGYIYVDAVQKNTHTANFSLSTNDRWSIAQEWDGTTPTDFLIGTVDEPAVWSRALTTGEIAYLYNNGQGNTPLSEVGVTITESGGNTVVKEGGATDSYQVVLDNAPTATVQITATPGDSEIDIGSGAGVAVILTFTTGNWSTPQTITVTAVDDDIYEGKTPHTTTITHTAQGGNYTGISIRSVYVSVEDNEQICGDWGYFQSDLNRDCYVDLLDFAIFAGMWLTSGN